MNIIIHEQNSDTELNKKLFSVAFSFVFVLAAFDSHNSNANDKKNRFICDLLVFFSLLSSIIIVQKENMSVMYVEETNTIFVSCFCLKFHSHYLEALAVRD